MRSAEEKAFAAGHSAESLMDEAGGGIAAAIVQFYPVPGQLILYLGKGNNAGDALVVGRILNRLGWRIWLRRSPRDPLGELPQKKLDQLGAAAVDAISSEDFIGLPGPLLLIDGLLGIGASGPLRDWVAKASAEILDLRASHQARVVAIDIPSGVDCDTGAVADGSVCADQTFTVAAGKIGLVADAATNHVGRLGVIPVPRIPWRSTQPDETLATPAELLPLLPSRSFDFHKGQAGRVGVVAGSTGMFGAARLCAEAALRGGAGLVTLFVRAEDLSIVAPSLPAEIMVQPINDLSEVAEHRLDALAIGPGLGTQNQEAVVSLCRQTPLPAVLDADALNAIAAESPGALPEMKGPRLLTPHPGEMRRLTPGLGAEIRRIDLARNYVKGSSDTAILLKGARTLVAADGLPTSFNTTGHPGMATAGMGDVLTGVAAAFLATEVPVYDAGRLAAWLCGRAAERALIDGESLESVVASSVLRNLGGAFNDLRNGVF